MEQKKIEVERWRQGVEDGSLLL